MEAGAGETRAHERLQEIELLDQLAGCPLDERDVGVGDAAPEVIALRLIQGRHQASS